MSITLTYNATSITLRNPELGDTYNLDLNTINRQSRGGTLISYKDSDWPIVTTFTYTILSLTETKIDELITFLENSQGKQITLVDYLSDTYVGNILTSIPEIIIGRDNALYDISFIFRVDNQSTTEFYLYTESGEEILTEDSENLLQEN